MWDFTYCTLYFIFSHRLSAVQAHRRGDEEVVYLSVVESEDGSSGDVSRLITGYAKT